MKYIDLMRMSLGNLWRRKLRSFLTVLGVIIGTASIVVMVSLGIGINYSYIKQVESSGSLTQLDVYHYNKGIALAKEAGGKPQGASEQSDSDLVLDDKAVEAIAQIPHVEVATPVLESSVMARIGRYEGYLSIQGISEKAMMRMNLPIEKGSLPTDGTTLSLVMGSNIAQSFTNPKASSRELEEMYANGTWYDINFMAHPLLVIYDMDAYYQSQNPGQDPSQGHIAPPKKYQLFVAAILTKTQGNYDYVCIANIDALLSQLKKVFKNKPIPGQPTTASGKPRKTIEYNHAIVFVDDIKNASSVQDQIKAMGYECSSNMDWIKQMQEQSRTMQAVLGAIGAVSLLVAAIGITNTMMMSIYERTREIGILKVLGCSLPNIRSLFLNEAAFIGLMGGVLGVGLSYGISRILNRLLAANIMGGIDSVISVIPIWLSGAALIFAMLVGILAGLAPAVRATRLSPLAAIRWE